MAQARSKVGGERQFTFKQRECIPLVGESNLEHCNRKLCTRNDQDKQEEKILGLPISGNRVPLGGNEGTSEGEGCR